MKKVNSIKCIFGKKGMGKTFLAHQLIQEYDRFIIYDRKGEFKDLGIVIRSGRALAEYILDKGTQPHFRVDYVPQCNDFDYISYLIWGMQDLCFCVDEIDTYLNARNMPEYYGLMINLGRHDCLSLIGVSRRPAKVHRDLTSQADQIISFGMHEANDIKYLRDNGLGTAALELPYLKKKCYMIYDDTKSEIVLVKPR
jgi:hypothetical protein